MPALQQFFNANPVLAVGAVFIVGVIVVLAVRILLSTAGCLVRLAVTFGLIIGIVLLVRYVVMH